MDFQKLKSSQISRKRVFAICLLLLFSVGGAYAQKKPRSGEKPGATETPGSAEKLFLKDLEIVDTKTIVLESDTTLVIKIAKPVSNNARYQFTNYRIEEYYGAKNSNLIRRNIMAATHVLVTVNPGYDETDITTVFSEGQIGDPKRIPNSDTYIVPNKNPDDRDFMSTIKSTPYRNVSKRRQFDRMVKYIEYDYIVFIDLMPNDPSFSQLWGLNNNGANGGTADADIDAPEAWSQTTGNTNIVIGVIDTGIDYMHADLASNMWTNPLESAGTTGVDDDANGYVDDIYGWNFYSNTNNPIDDHYHGTHVAGTIGAVGNNGVGVTGVAWRVRMVALKFLGSSGSGAISDAIEAVKYASKIPNLIATNNSWGGGGYSQALKDAIDEAASKNILFIAAAGNNYNDNDINPTYPANYPCWNIISVAATDRNDNFATFSNYGQRSVHIGAPGVDIYSTLRNNTYGSLQGTSMAAPHVTGGCVLLKSMFPNLSAQQIKDKLLARGDRRSTLATRVSTGARLNVNSALIVVPPQETVIGSIVSFYGDPGYLPDNWVLCNGQIVNDPGSTVFNGRPVPDLRGRFLRGPDQKYPYNTIAGVDEIQKHSHYFDEDASVWHPIESGNGYSNAWEPASRADAFNRNYVTLSALKADPNPYNSHGHMNGIAQVHGLSDGGGAHTNLPAFYSLFYIIKIK